jgi:hypothetical protein
MKTAGWLLAASLALGASACSPGGPVKPSRSQGDQTEEAAIRANLAKLDPTDRKLAEEQTFCCVENENRLGSMGIPVKVLVQGQPVFLCCEGCRERALSQPEHTLNKAKELKTRAAGK